MSLEVESKGLVENDEFDKLVGVDVRVSFVIVEVSNVAVIVVLVMVVVIGVLQFPFRFEFAATNTSFPEHFGCFMQVAFVWVYK